MCLYLVHFFTPWNDLTSSYPIASTPLFVYSFGLAVFCIISRIPRPWQAVIKKTAFRSPLSVCLGAGTLACPSNLLLIIFVPHENDSPFRKRPLSGVYYQILGKGHGTLGWRDFPFLFFFTNCTVFLSSVVVVSYPRACVVWFL